MTNPQPLDAVRETAAELLKEIAKEREALIKAGKIKKTKPLPEITDDEIPYEIPENWEWVRLGDIILENVGGGTPDKSKTEYWNGSIPWASVKDLKSNSLDETIDKITPAGLENSSSNLIPKGNVIVCTRMGLGKVAINSINVAINQDLRALILSKYVSKEYFVNYYSTLIIEGDGATVKGISINTLHNYLIPLPPLSEQKRIVALLDELLSRIDKARENIEKNIENAEELLQTSLDLIHCPKEELGKIVNICTGKLNANQAVEDGQYPFFTCSRTASKIDRYAYDCEAILLAGNNASGDFNVKHYKGKFEAYQRTYILTAKDEKNIDYRFLYFQVMRSLETLKKEAVGTNTKFLRLPMIQSLKIAYPNISEQREYVKKIDALLLSINKLTQSYKQKLIDLDELRNSVLEKAFRGELT